MYFFLTSIIFSITSLNHLSVIHINNMFYYSVCMYRWEDATQGGKYCTLCLHLK